MLIAPGQYFDCAIVYPSHVTIAGDGEGAVITDKACEGKALLVLRGTGDVIRNLTLARARVPDGNGAGVRLEGQDLLLQGVTFDNDQVGLLSGSAGGTIDIEDCRFTGGGVGGDMPKFAVLVGPSALLRVQGSSFSDVKGGQITSAADRTELLRNTIATGAGDGPAAAVVGRQGSLLMEDNVLRVGPSAPPRGGVVWLLDDASATLRRNRLVNETGQRLTLLLDWSHGPPRARGEPGAIRRHGGQHRRRLATPRLEPIPRAEGRGPGAGRAAEALRAARTCSDGEPGGEAGGPAAPAAAGPAGGVGAVRQLRAADVAGAQPGGGGRAEAPRLHRHQAARHRRRDRSGRAAAP